MKSKTTATTMKDALKGALAQVIERMGANSSTIPIQDVPEDKSGDYGSPVAFVLAKQLKQNPVQLAQHIVAELALPEGIASAEAVGPYINFHVDMAHFAAQVSAMDFSLPSIAEKIVVEHTSVNPNKEAHVGHLRNVVLGDTLARILRAAGYDVEIQNYIDDTGRQAAESFFAREYFQAEYDGSQKYDHWLGALYVRLNQAKEHDGDAIEQGVSKVMHQLEQGELRAEVEEIVRAQLETYYKLGAEYDLLVWESDVVASGFLQRGLDRLQDCQEVGQPTEGKYEGAMVMDVSGFIKNLEESHVVLVRSDGNAMYVAKDIGYHLWKVGLLSGIRTSFFDTQPSGHILYTSHPEGEAGDEDFAHADRVVNVIDIRQSHSQRVVKAALQLTDSESNAEKLHHFAYEVVTLEGQAMSGRKGITYAIDTAITEASQRAKIIMQEKSPDLADIDTVAEQVGIGALRFSMLKNEAKKMLDFRTFDWESALSLQGDSAPYVQYAHARACKILRDAEAAGSRAEADWSQISALEMKLLKKVAALPEAIQTAARDLAPHQLAQYTLEVATAWNSYYNHKDDAGKSDTKILDAPAGLREARLAMVNKVREALGYALETLGIAAPEQM